MRPKKTRTITGERTGPQTVTYNRTKGDAILDLNKAKKKGLKNASGSKTRSVSYTNLDQHGGDVKSGLTAKTKTNAKGKSKTKVISTEKAVRQMRRKNPRYGHENKPKDYVPNIPSGKTIYKNKSSAAAAGAAAGAAGALGAKTAKNALKRPASYKNGGAIPKNNDPKVENKKNRIAKRAKGKRNPNLRKKINSYEA